MTPHPSTCQCGGSGFEKSSTDNSLKIPIPCTPSQEIVEWEKESESIFHEIAIRGDASDEAYQIVIGKGLNFIRSLLTSHSQALQERHEAEMRELEEVMFGVSLVGKTKDEVNYHTEYCQCPGRKLTWEEMKEAFNKFRATHLNPKS